MSPTAPVNVRMLASFPCALLSCTQLRYQSAMRSEMAMMENRAPISPAAMKAASAMPTTGTGAISRTAGSPGSPNAAMTTASQSIPCSA